jgi:hypothetical protein
MHLNEIEEKSIEELSFLAQSTIASKLNLK